MNTSITFFRDLKDLKLQIWTYGKPAPGAAFFYEFCCSFPQNAHTLHAQFLTEFYTVLKEPYNGNKISHIYESYHLTENYRKGKNCI